MNRFTPHIYQVKVTLQGVEPPVWRRLLIPADLFLHDFHKVLQTGMGWENQHVHLFLKGRKVFGIADDEWSVNSEFQDYTIVRVNDLLRKAGDEMIYRYDMGDDWRHTVTLEKDNLEPDPMEYYPICTGGARDCPPEDCGGPMDYMELVAAVKDPSSPQYGYYKTMFPEGLEPEYFDLDEINAFLLEDNYGCMFPFEDDE